MHNGYTAIESGWAVETIVDLTCGVPEEFPHDNEDVKAMIWDGSYWQKILNSIQTGKILCASSARGSDSEKSAQGITLGHAYTILDAVEIDGYKLV